MDAMFAWPDLTTQVLGKRDRYLREEKAGWRDDTCAFGRSRQTCARWMVWRGGDEAEGTKPMVA